MTGEGNMKTLLKIELERAFKNKWFYITLCIELVLVIADVCTVKGRNGLDCGKRLSYR